MTVAQLIDELQKHAGYKPVRVVMCEVGPLRSITDLEADQVVVVYEGSHVAIEGR